MLVLVGLGILCLAMFATERVTGQCVLTQIGKMNLYDYLYVFFCLIGYRSNFSTYLFLEEGCPQVL